MCFGVSLYSIINKIENRHGCRIHQLNQWKRSYKKWKMVKTHTLMTDLRAFKTKYIYDQSTKINHILFYISYQLFETIVRNSLTNFNLKCYYYRSKFYNISNLLLYNVFAIFEIILNTYKIKIRGLFFNEGDTWDFDIS